jgi:anti-sigma factor (TIGR02949 family)
MNDCVNADCQEIRKQLEEFLHGELCAEDSAPLREHLAQCSECQGEEAALNRLTAAVKRACSEKAPVSLREAIATAIREDAHFDDATDAGSAGAANTSEPA